MDLWFNLREKVDEFDVSGQQELACRQTAQVELRVQQLILYNGAENKRVTMNNGAENTGQQDDKHL